MENQEDPKKLTPEEIEQQKKNLEQKQEEQIPKENDAVLLSNINKEITKKEENIQNTQNEINDIRSQLGLSTSNEIPPSIKNAQDSIGKLNQERANIEAKIQEVISRASLKVGGVPTLTDSKDIQEYKELNKQLENIENKNSNEIGEKPEETKRFEENLKVILDDISIKSKKILDALDYRYQKNLISLIKREDFFTMNSTIKNLGNIESKIDINTVSKIIDGINQLNQLFNNIEIQKSSNGEVKEENQNLEILADSVKRFSASVDESGRKLPIEMEDKKMEEKSKELRVSLQKLAEQSQKFWLFTSKLREGARY